MCKGLDVFSIDSYRDDPNEEVGVAKAAYANVIPHLRKPNTCKTRQALSRSPVGSSY